MFGNLYRRSYAAPYLRCLRHAEAQYALREVHEGICGQHLRGRALAYKVLRQGYYWPNLQQDAVDFVKKCDKCQKFAVVPHQPATTLSSISSPLPFAMWGMDILGPFTPALGNRKFVVVAIDYFTKWVEAEPLALITEKNIRNFFKKSVVFRFGVPRTVITDNGKQFDNAKFKNFCEEFGIDHRKTSVGHPQSNGQTEVTNRTLLQGLKKKLDDAKGLWADELQNVLWAYRTTSRSPTGETPFMLSYGTEAVIPVEIGMPTLRVERYNEETNDADLRTNLDLLEGVREQAMVKMAAYKQRTAHYYNSRVRERVFREGDLVLRKTEVSDPTNTGKLTPNWEGPYRVTKVVRPGSYHLETLGGKEIPRAWNSENLKKYFQ